MTAPPLANIPFFFILQANHPVSNFCRRYHFFLKATSICSIIEDKRSLLPVNSGEDFLYTYRFPIINFLFDGFYYWAQPGCSALS